MFPIRWNFPFRKKDGSLSTIGSEIENAGGTYTLPTASAETKGGVKIGSGLAMEGEVLNNSNPTPYSLPTASSETLGGVKVGSGLTINEGVLSASGGGFTKIATLTRSTGTNEVVIDEKYNFLFMYAVRTDGTQYHCEIFTSIEELDEIQQAAYNNNIVFTSGGYFKYSSSNIQAGNKTSACIYWDPSTRKLTFENLYQDTSATTPSKLVVYAM